MEAWDGYGQTGSHRQTAGVAGSLPEETTRAASSPKGRKIDIAYLLTGRWPRTSSAPGLQARRPEGFAGHVCSTSRPVGSEVRWHDRASRQAPARDRPAGRSTSADAGSPGRRLADPAVLEFSRFFEPDPSIPAKARRLLAEAAYANGFDAGASTVAAYFSMGAALGGYLPTSGSGPGSGHGARGHDHGWREKNEDRDRRITARRQRRTRLGRTSARTGSTPASRVRSSERPGRGTAEESANARPADPEILHERVTHIPLYELRSSGRGAAWRSLASSDPDFGTRDRSKM